MLTIIAMDRESTNRAPLRLTALLKDIEAQEEWLRLENQRLSEAVHSTRLGDRADIFGATPPALLRATIESRSKYASLPQPLLRRIFKFLANWIQSNSS